MTLAACAGGDGARRRGTAEGVARVALLPLENLSGAAIPVKEIMDALELSLARTGIDVVSGDAVEEFLARHRLRNTGGVDADSAVAARRELGVDAIVITSVGLYSATAPPKVAITMRLVAAAEDPAILWMDAASASGDDSPGLFGLGLVGNVERLRRDVLAALAHSMKRATRGDRPRPPCSEDARYSPQVAFRSAALPPKDRYSVAVLPFLNQTKRRSAGDAIALEFVRQLSGVEGIRVVEPGVVRQFILGVRMVQEGGVSLEQARLLTDVLDADLVLAGTVRDYQESGTAPTVDFTALLIHRRGRQVVWESTSHNRGDDTLTLFGVGRIGTANGLACRMVRHVVKGISAMTPRPRRAASAADRAPEPSTVADEDRRAPTLVAARNWVPGRLRRRKSCGSAARRNREIRFNSMC